MARLVDRCEVEEDKDEMERSSAASLQGIPAYMASPSQPASHVIQSGGQHATAAERKENRLNKLEWTWRTDIQCYHGDTAASLIIFECAHTHTHTHTLQTDSDS